MLGYQDIARYSLAVAD